MSATIITGGASWIALDVAHRLVSAGGSVVLADHNEAARAEAEGLIGGRGLYLTGDVRNDGFLDDVIAAASELDDNVSGVVSAAVTFDESALSTTRDEWQRALDINLVSAAVLTDKAAPVLERGGGGSIVYVASISGFRAQPTRVVYNVTKAGLHMLAKTAATQLARRGIRVNSVSPGWTWSRNLERRYGDRAYADAFAGEFQTMGRLADPGEIAAGIVWLLSDGAAFVTGTDLAIDGGYSALGPEALGQPFEKYPPREDAT